MLSRRARAVSALKRGASTAFSTGDRRTVKKYVKPIDTAALAIKIAATLAKPDCGFVAEQRAVINEFCDLLRVQGHIAPSAIPILWDKARKATSSDRERDSVTLSSPAARAALLELLYVTAGNEFTDAVASAYPPYAPDPVRAEGFLSDLWKKYCR